ncbi:MAG: hypothetical protein KJO26_01265, partial [Deltaproteobacteria bacterium]|nr:hypothetical protein [Deltaproteobacteria bacterium]
MFTIIVISIWACSLNQNQTTPTKKNKPHTLEPIIQLGHSDEVTNALFIPNTGYVATSSLDGSVKLWESGSGREVKTLKEPKTQKRIQFENRRRIQKLNITNKYYSLAVSPDGKFLIAGDIFGRINIWGTSSGDKIKSVKSILRNQLINSIAFSSDGKKFVTGSEDGRLQIWDFSRRSITNRLNKHSLQVNSVAIGPNDRYILSGSSDGSLILWDIFSNKSKFLQRGSSEIRAVALSSDGKSGLSGDSDYNVTLWNISTGVQIQNFQGSGKVNSVSFSPDNRYFASGHENSSVMIWDVLTGNVVKSFFAKRGAVNSVQYSPNGDYILAGYADGTSVMWRMQNSALVHIFQGYSNTPFSISISNNNEFLLSGVNNNTLNLWNIKEGKLIKTYNWQPSKNKIQLSSHITSVGFSSNKQFVTVLNSNGERKNWDILTGEEIDLSINNFSLKFQNADHLPDGRILSSRYGASYAIIINPHTNRISKLGQHNTGVTAVRFSVDGKIALSGERAGLIKIWKPPSFHKKGELKGHLDVVTSICLTNDNRLVGSSSKDNTVRIWDRINQEEIVKLVSSKDEEWIIATPDGYYNTSPEGSNLIHWSSIKNKETFTFEQFETLFKRPDIIKARLSGNFDAGKPAPEITMPPS